MQLKDPEKNEDKTIKKFTKKLFNHTSVNGMFMVLVAGTKSQNAVAGIIVKKPEET